MFTNFLQALNKLRKETWGVSHDSVNLRPSTRVSFEVFIERVKAVVDAGDYFYLKRNGKFDSMPACWKNLEELQRREVATLIGSFYTESHGDCTKDPWSVPNLKKYLNLGYVKLEDLPKFRAAYFATLGDDSVLAEPLHFVEPPSENTNLLDDHDGFAFKPKKLLKEYTNNRSDSKVQGRLFVHMTNHVTTQHCVAAKKKPDGRFVDLEPSAALDIHMTEFQRIILNPTTRDVVVSDLIDQAQGERAKKKEGKRKRDIVTGNINSYSRILNTEESLEKFQDYNNLSAGLGMINAEKDAKAKEAAAKKIEEAKEKLLKKAGKESEEIRKRDELLSGFEEELQINDVGGILRLSDARMRHYIRYYFQKKIVNLTKTKKAELKAILSPLLEEYYEEVRGARGVAIDMHASTEDTVTFASGIKCGMGDGAEGLSAEEV